MQLLKVAFAVAAALCYVLTAYAERPIGIRNGTDWKVGSGLIICKEVNYGDCLVMTNRGGQCSTVEVNILNISEFNIFLSALPTPGHACELF
ncbi:hypothetical protein KC340_g11529 [Hortaea werneckii]|nr:hypothetical protein KC342_g11771 [Hortaea werneckii]KAI7081170.1 hypothetical protein KC339_g13384 [Hortaea werneckii]KAI7216485.1 hypothetical protein KC365_g13242 [Hortaea werneckii]KAI7307129.1 hypothetical protein KC340_g11529 [Hortaea werneckii]KAI7389957.1 hypothetical protein KC328_g8180 [Hortaea werneckii]